MANKKPKPAPKRGAQASGQPITAQPLDAPAPNSALTQEVAVADPRFGLYQSGFYRQRHWNPDELIGRKGLKIYNDMRRDEQVKAAMYTKKFSIIAAGWEIGIDEQQKGNKNLDKLKRFVEFNLNEMEGTVESFLTDALTALDYGYSVTEPAYKLIDYGEFSGLYGFKALKVRRPEQIDFEMDQYGNLFPDGLLQGMKRLPVNRFAIFTYRKEFGNPYGNSDLREAYRPWFMKDNIVRFMAMALERYGQPIAVATTKTTLSSTEKATLLTILETLQSRTGLILPETIVLDLKQPSPRTAEAFIPALNKLDQWIAMAVLLPSLLGMGGGQQAAGSYSRSQTEFDTFLWIIEQLRKELSEWITDRIIKVLLDLNFEVDDGIYPAFKFKELTHERKLEILDMYNKALAAGSVTKTRDDEEAYRSLADFPELPDDVVAAGTYEAAQRDQKDQAAQQAQAMKLQATVAASQARANGQNPNQNPNPIQPPDKGFPPKKAPSVGAVSQSQPGRKLLEDDQSSVELFHLPGQHDQLDHGNRGGELADTAIKAGGFTYNPVRINNREPPKNGFAVAFDKSTEKAFSAKAGRDQLRQKIVSYIKDHRDVIKQPGNYLGGWYDKGSGKVFLDISKVLADKKQAIDLAKQSKQIAIFDLGAAKSIDVQPELRKAA